MADSKLTPASSIIVILLLSIGLWRLWTIRSQRALDNAFGGQHGCLPIQNILEGRLPMGLDLVRILWHGHMNQCLMAVQQNFVDEMGPNLELRLLGNKGLVTTDPENIKTILSKSRFREGGELDFTYGARRAALLPLLGEGLFTQDGHAWKRSREMVRKQFVRIQYSNLEVFTDHVELLISRLRTSNESIVDLHPLFGNFTLDTTTSLLFGDTAGSLHEESTDEFGSNLSSASWFSAVRVQLAYLYWLCYTPRFAKACSKVRQYADFWVKRALDERKGNDDSDHRYAFIRSLNDELQDRGLVRDQLVNILLAGRDSTAALLSWTVRLLVRHEDVLTKLRREVSSVLGSDTNVSKVKLQQMPYLKCIITETLRLYPSVPINLREANHTTILPRGGGKDGQAPLLMPKGMGVGYAPYYMHRRKDLYGDDAFSFRPERWEDGSLHERVGWGYLPFNGGPRVCLGQEFALLEASYAIVRIVQSFPTLSLPADEEVVPIGEERQLVGLTLAPGDGCRVRL